MYQNILDYIRENWEKTVRFMPKDEGTVIGLPYPFTVPCVQNNFQEMYYWDTYFTDIGLIKHGMWQQAKYNCDNMRHLIRRFGFMPNGSRTWYRYRSQPPYLSMMIRDVYAVTGDKEWLRECYADLRTEYTFWMTRRITETGLNRYGSEAPADDCLQFARDFDRVPYEKTATAEYTARGFQAECESGWDFSDRFEQRCLEFNPVDLNSNLFLYEKNFAFMEKELAITPDTDWEAVAAARAERINVLCWDKEAGIYKDYDFLHERPSKTPSAAGFHPYYAGIAPADRVTGIDNLLSLIEAPHGITCTPKSDRLYFQWGYPNGWAPLHYIAVRGMDKYEKKEDAARVAGKYLATVADNFAATGHIWEKYNVVTGDTNVVNEYEMPDMMGWSAGVFVALCDYLAE